MNTLRRYVTGLDTPVPINGGRRPYINLDNAASTPPFASVMKTITEYVPWYASVHRGNGLKSRISTRLYEEARQTVGGFVGARESEHVVIFGKNATEAINKLSYRLSLSKKDIVLISHLEHHSNDLPWRARATVKRIAMTADGSIDTDHYLALLEKYQKRVKLVSITGGSNVTGHMPNIHWFARKAHEAGAQIAIDAAQLAPHRGINMGRLDDPSHLDYVVLSAHKMYAPFGTGALIGRRDTFERGEPEYRGGGTVEVVTTKTVDWAMPADKDEAGSPNVIGAVALARAIRTIDSIGMDVIARHEAMLTEYALKKLKDIPQITLYGSTDPTKISQRLGVIPLIINDVPANLVAAILGYEWGIGVRSGCFCAHPYVMSLLGVKKRHEQQVRGHVLHRRKDLAPGMVRLSFGLYNTKDEIDKVVEALKSVASGDHGEYNLDKATGVYQPSGSSVELLPFSLL